MDDKRYFENPYSDYDGELQLLTSENMLLPSVVIKIKSFIIKQWDGLEKHIKVGMFDKHNYSLYTGYLGVIMLFLKFPNDNKTMVTDKYRNLVTSTIARLTQKRISFSLW